MSSTQRVQGALTPNQEELCRGFLTAAMKRSAENMEMLLGRPVAIAIDAMNLEHDASLRLRMPATGVICSNVNCCSP